MTLFVLCNAMTEFMIGALLVHSPFVSHAESFVSSLITFVNSIPRKGIQDPELNLLLLIACQTFRMRKPHSLISTGDLVVSI